MIYNFVLVLQLLLAFLPVKAIQKSSTGLAPLTFAGKRLPEVLTIMKEWGYDSLVRDDINKTMLFKNVRWPRSPDSCSVGIQYSQASDTVISIICIKGSLSKNFGNQVVPSSSDTSDFRRWDSSLTLELGWPTDSVANNNGIFLYWKGIEETILRFVPGDKKHRYNLLLYNCFWKREKKDGSHYTEEEIRKE